MAMSASMRPGPSEITHKNMRFLIMDRPTDATLATFLEELKKRNVTDVVRVCEPTYNTHPLQQEGIQVHDWQFDDGSPPPQDIVNQWLNLLIERFLKDIKEKEKDRHDERSGSYVAIHCVAGLGRAPVLVALALMELGMKYEDAVELIRQKRRGAINQKQLQYLASYRPKGRLKPPKQGGGGHPSCCMF